MTTRRDFLKLILAAGIAPAVIKADRLMKVRPVRKSGDLLYTFDDSMESLPGDWVKPASEELAREIDESIVQPLLLSPGDIITIAGVYAPGGQTLQQFITIEEIRDARRTLDAKAVPLSTEVALAIARTSAILR